MALEVLVHGCLACGSKVHYGGRESMLQEACSLHGGQEVKIQEQAMETPPMT
jgi:hypothetical protein